MVWPLMACSLGLSLAAFAGHLATPEDRESRGRLRLPGRRGGGDPTDLPELREVRIRSEGATRGLKHLKTVDGRRL